jgi:hypothetical protein
MGGYPRGQAAAIVAKANPTLGPLFASQPVCLRSSVKVSADDGLAIPCGAKNDVTGRVVRVTNGVTFARDGRWKHHSMGQ